MPPHSYKKRTLYFTAFTILFIILVPMVIPLATGYRLTEGFKIVRTGAIYISDIPNDAEVYIDYKPVRGTPLYFSAFFVQNLRPASYLVVIAKEGYWSWAKHIEVKENRVVEAAALLLPKNPEKTLVPQRNAVGETATGTLYRINREYADVLEFFAAMENAERGTLENPIRKGRILLWHEGRDIYVRWNGSVESAPLFFCSASECELSKKIYTAPRDIYQLEFFPERNDVILVATERGINAVELDTRPEQNTLMIYEGKAVRFVISEEDERFYIEEGGDLYRLTI